MTYTDDEAAVFGGLDYSNGGFYAGTWLSTMTSNTEVDLYAGFSGETGSSEYDIGVIRYSYLDTADDDYYELYGSLTFSGLTIGGAYTIESQATDTAAGQEAFIEGDVYLYAVIPSTSQRRLVKDTASQVLLVSTFGMTMA